MTSLRRMRGCWKMETSPSNIERCYTCTFCKRGFSNAQALGGHMNIHRRDRARLRESSNETLLDHPPASADLQLVEAIHKVEDAAEVSMAEDGARKLLQLPLFVEKPSVTTDADVSSSGARGHLKRSMQMELYQSLLQTEVDLELRLGRETQESRDIIKSGC